MLLEPLRNIKVPSLPTWFFGDASAARRRNRLHVVHMHSHQTDKDGNLLWVEDGWQDNILHTQGEIYILSRAFDTNYSGAPTGWDPSGWTTAGSMYLGLDDRAAPSEGDDLGDITGEPSGSNYSRIELDLETGFEIQDSGSGYWRVRTPTGVGSHQFSASGGNWPEVTQRFICTDASATASAAGDLLIATVALSTGRTLNDGDNLNTNLLIGLSES